jgi:hypothetical protein
MNNANNSDSLRLIIYSAQLSHRAEITVEWPIIKKTEWLIRVQLPGGETSLLRHDVSSIPKVVAEDEIATKFIKAVRHAAVGGRGDDVVVPVKRVSKGPTEKSAKYKVTVRYRTRDIHGEAEVITRAHTLTLARSKLLEMEREGAVGQYMPSWVIRSALKRRDMIGEFVSVNFPWVVWLGEPALVAQLEAVRPRLRQAEAEAEERDRKMQAERERLEQLRREREEKLQRELQERERHRAARKRPPRVPDQRIEGCKVEWAEWYQRKGWIYRTDRVAESCVVEVFGKKHVIYTPDGEIITKMQGRNLKIKPKIETKTSQQE